MSEEVSVDVSHREGFLVDGKLTGQEVTFAGQVQDQIGRITYYGTHCKRDPSFLWSFGQAVKMFKILIINYAEKSKNKTIKQYLTDLENDKKEYDEWLKNHRHLFIEEIDAEIEWNCYLFERYLEIAMLTNFLPTRGVTNVMN